MTGNLPRISTRFIGRSREMIRVGRLLAANRLVTITGPAGMGKTRLALEVAEGLVDDHANGAWLVELGAVAEPSLVPGALAQALGLAEMPGRSITEVLIAHLRRSQLLMVLDNCEHLVVGCAELVGDILGSCAAVSVVATSQQPLGLDGVEAVFALGSLSLPVGGRVASSDACALFLERAREARSELSLRPDLVADICLRLDGLPLAIELAAARTDIMSLAEIAALLDDRFALLASRCPTGTQVLNARHHSLQAALEWSYELLDYSHQALLRRVSVFAGGATLAAIGAVVSGDDLSVAQIPEALDALIARSLLFADGASPTPRCRVLETVRLFGYERLAEAEEAEPIRARHVAWFVSLAEQAEPELTGARQQEWLNALEADHDNLRSAIGWALGHGECEKAQRLAGSLTLFWRVRSHLREGLDWLDQVLDAGEADVAGQPAAARAKALWGAGFLHHMVAASASEPSPAPLLEKALAYQRAAGDTRGVARSLLILADCAVNFGSSDRLRLLDDSATAARESGDSWCLAHALSSAASTRHDLGDVSSARLMHEEAVCVARAAGDAQSLAFATNGFGHFWLNQGDYDVAQGLLAEALELARTMGDTHGQSVILGSLGRLAERQGRYPEASAHFHEAREVIEKSGGRLVDLLPPLVYLARLAVATGDLVQAEELFAQLRPMLKQIGTSHPLVLDAMATAASASGDHQRARALLDEAEAMCRSSADVGLLATVQHSSGLLARQGGDLEAAAASLQAALALRAQSCDKSGMVESLEALAGVAAQAGRWEYSLRLFGATQACRAAGGYARSPTAETSYQADVDRLRRNCESATLQGWWDEGARLPLAAAISYATRGRGARSTDQGGWESLSPTQAEVAELVGQGLTNSAIAAQLLMSANTVKAHLKKIFFKLDVESRWELRERYRQEKYPVG